MDIQGTIPSYLNHSCDPSSYIDFSTRLLVVRATRDLKSDAEITFDYDLTEWDIASPFKCGCGSVHCRRVIRGLKHRPIEVKRLYTALHRHARGRSMTLDRNWQCIAKLRARLHAG